MNKFVISIATVLVATGMVFMSEGSAQQYGGMRR